MVGRWREKKRLTPSDLSLISCLSWQVMLKDMEHSKKSLEEELQKTSEVSVGDVLHVRVRSSDTHHGLRGCWNQWNVLLSFPESVFDGGGERASKEPSAGGWGRGGATAGQQRRAGLRGGHPAAGGRDQRPEEPAGHQEARTRGGGHQGGSSLVFYQRNVLPHFIYLNTLITHKFGFCI